MIHYCVISHTHWDREWYMPLESMKLRLCDLLDHCLDILRTQPEYVFHLDAQTIVLEDYLEIRPWRRTELEARIRERRLMVGPWYLQNDYYLTSGEATVRNLLEGRMIAEQFGYVDSVGYAPDQFGNISQLPQILQNFDIDTFVFGRGLSKQQPDGTPMPSEFVWEGADGSKVLGIFLYFWYNNAQHISQDISKAKILLENLERDFSTVAGTPFLLLMNGVDHLEPQEDLLSILNELNKELPENMKIGQCRLSDYVNQVKKWYLDHGGPKYVHKGELRQGPDTVLLKGTLSSRSYLKIENVKAQTMLENKLEPLYSMLELAGLDGAYSTDHFRYMWKQLLRNHPHDSICGCSRDEVHRHMEDNYSRLKTTSDDMLSRALRLAASHIDIEGRSEDNFLITVANTTQRAMDTVVKVDVDIPRQLNAKGINIFSQDGKQADYIVLSKKSAIKDGFSPLNLPGTIPVDRYTVSLRTETVEPFAFKGFLVEASKKANIINTFIRQEVNDKAVAENDYIRVEVDNYGRVDISNKKTKCYYSNIMDIEDTGDWGDSYVYIKAVNDPTIFASQFPAKVNILRNDRHRQEIEILKNMLLPIGYDEATGHRTTAAAEVPIRIIISVSAGDPFAEISLNVHNTVKNHRMRLLIKTGIMSTGSLADIPFDCVSHTDDDHDKQSWTKVLPNSSFACLENEQNGVCVLTEGTHEYEHIVENGTLAFTLFRANGIIARNYDTLEQSGGDQWLCPDNQCLRDLEFNFGILPYSESALKAMIPVHSTQFRTRIMAWYDAGDCRKFMHGRPAVQDSRLEEYYYLPDQYRNIVIPNNKSLISVDGNALVTALKMANNNESIIMRMVNLDEQKTRISVFSDRNMFKTTMDEQTMMECSSNNIEMRGKEILTLALQKIHNNN